MSMLEEMLYSFTIVAKPKGINVPVVATGVCHIDVDEGKVSCEITAHVLGKRIPIKIRERFTTRIKGAKEIIV